MDVQETNRQALAAVQERRDEFYEAVLALERAIATPAGDDAVAWAADTANAVDATQRVLDHHVTETEAPGSFYDDVLQHNPGLARSAERLRSEHGPLQGAVADLRTQLTDVTDEDGVDTARQAALDVIKALLQHRHRGAELVYDAYNIDVATGD